MNIENGRVLLPDGSQPILDLTLRRGRIERLGGGGEGRRFDARGLLVLPGIVDLHGDAFERQLQPRPGVGFPVLPALRDTEAQLLASGITTAMHAITLSWEPGLRGAETWRALLDAMEAWRPSMRCDMRIHLRWELHNLQSLEMALADIEAGRVALLSFNDHTREILDKMERPAKAAQYTERSGIGLAEFRALAERAMANDPAVPGASERLAEAARRHRLPIASHDDRSVPVREAFRALGSRICEFPMSEAVGIAAREAGDAVVMGCPNVVRGGSHMGWASAASMAERGICTVLVSDYYYPAMPAAPLALAKRGTLSLAQAWALVSANPAKAAGLDDRGMLAEGARADLVLLDPEDGAVVATVAAGQLAYLGPGAWSRIG